MVLTDTQKTFVELALGLRLTDPTDSHSEAVEAQKEQVSSLLRTLKRTVPETLETAQQQMEEIEALIANGQPEDAHEMMDALELDIAATLPPSNVAFQKLRLRWQDAKRSAATDLTALQNAVTAEFDDAEAASSAKRLEEVIASFNAGLSDALDDVMNTEHGSQRTELCKTAGRVTSDYLDFVFGSPMIQHVQSNPFFAIDLEATLAQPLQLIEIELAKDGT